MNLLFRIILIFYLVVPLILLMGCSSREKNNPITSNDQNNQLEKREKVELIGKAFGSEAILFPNSNYNVPLGKSSRYSSKDINSQETDKPTTTIEYGIETTGPDSEGWYTIRCIACDPQPDIKSNEIKYRIIEVDGIVKKEWKGRTIFLSGKTIEGHSTITYENREFEEKGEAVIYILNKVKTTIPLTKGTFYTVSFVYNNILRHYWLGESESFGSATFITSDNWTGKIDYNDIFELTRDTDGNVIAESLTGRSITGYINDENGNKIAIINYFDDFNSKDYGKYFYYIMVDDPNQEVHRIEL